jgi:hypothetical protein
MFTLRHSTRVIVVQAEEKYALGHKIKCGMTDISGGVLFVDPPVSVNDIKKRGDSDKNGLVKKFLPSVEPRGSYSCSHVCHWPLS